MRLLGAREFLKTVKPGTLCVEFWLDSEEECFKLIEEYKSGADFFQGRYAEFYIFGDNTGSLAFFAPEVEEEQVIQVIDGHEYDCLNFYDKNIVGDASPWTTLQLVYDSEDEWPEEVYIEGAVRSPCAKNMTLNKDDLRRIIKHFLTENKFYDETKEGWALKALDEEGCKGHPIIDYKEETK